MNNRGRLLLSFLLIGASGASATLAHAAGHQSVPAVGGPAASAGLDLPRSRAPEMPAPPPNDPYSPSKRGESVVAPQPPAPYNPPNKGGGGQPPEIQKTTCNGGMGQATGDSCSCKGVDLKVYSCWDLPVTEVNGLSSNSPMHACVCND